MAIAYNAVFAGSYLLWTHFANITKLPQLVNTWNLSAGFPVPVFIELTLKRSTFRMESVVRITRILLALSIALVVNFATSSAYSAGIEAVKGKKYRLTKQHGPWMVFVASLSQPKEGFRGEGLTPQEAADELVYELRKQGVPAYTYSQEEEVENLKTVDRRGRLAQRSFLSQKGSVCVLAGNYKSNSSDTAQKTLKWIETKFDPELFATEQATNGIFTKLASGGVFRSTPGRKRPLQGAFLTVNPLLSPDEARSRKRDPLLLKLNNNSNYTIMNNKGKYTLVIASFYGKSVTSVGESKFQKAKQFFNSESSGLDDAAREANALVYHMRNIPAPYEPFEAYVFHDRYKSVVTVGSFDSPKDPLIRKAIYGFSAKMRWSPVSNKNVLTGETITLPLRPTAQNPIRKEWLFDPKPRLIEVPKI